MDKIYENEADRHMGQRHIQTDWTRYEIQRQNERWDKETGKEIYRSDKGTDIQIGQRHRQSDWTRYKIQKGRSDKRHRGTDWTP